MKALKIKTGVICMESNKKANSLREIKAKVRSTVREMKKKNMKIAFRVKAMITA